MQPLRLFLIEQRNAGSLQQFFLSRARRWTTGSLARRRFMKREISPAAACSRRENNIWFALSRCRHLPAPLDKVHGGFIQKHRVDAAMERFISPLWLERSAEFSESRAKVCKFKLWRQCSKKPGQWLQESSTPRRAGERKGSMENSTFP